MPAETYQVEPGEIFHPDIAEQYRRALSAYRHAAGQDLGEQRGVALLGRNRHGWVWLGTAVAITLFFLTAKRRGHGNGSNRE